MILIMMRTRGIDPVFVSGYMTMTYDFVLLTTACSTPALRQSSVELRANIEVPCFYWTWCGQLHVVDSLYVLLCKSSWCDLRFLVELHKIPCI